VNRVQELTNQGWLRPAIAHELGVSVRMVSHMRFVAGCRQMPSPEDIERRREQVKSMTLAGWTAEAIAHELGVTARTVQRDREDRKCIRPRSAPISAEDITLAGEMLDEGMPLAEVGRTLGHSTHVLARHFTDRVVDRRAIYDYVAAMRRHGSILA
jgi:hypothetical protein